MTIRKLFRTALFVCILILLMIVAGRLFQPKWYEWNNYHTIHDFYHEPENRVETVFLGSSVVVNGISPMQMYEEYGLCTYNLGTEQQPMSASWAWLQEAYRMHPDTLKVIVLDTSLLTHDANDAFFYKAIERMNDSEIKREAFREFVHNCNDLSLVSLPLFHYHERWKELTKEDWKQERLPNYTRGYNLDMNTWIEDETITEWVLPQCYYDTSCDPMMLHEKSLEYLKKIILFCQEKKLQLVLTKIPVLSWDSSAHKAVQELADQYRIQFYDFNFSPCLDQLDIQCLLDLTDGQHMNYSGAVKISHWWGQWLSENTECEDKRNARGYEYLETQLEQYKKETTTHLELHNCRDVTEYIQYAGNIEDSVVLISICDEGTNSLTDEQKEVLREYGLTKLSQLGYRDSYLALITDKGVRLEMDQQDAKTNGNNESLSVDYLLPQSARVKMYSCGLGHGETYSSICIDDIEYSPNKRGINIVVIDIKKDRVIDSACFDTFASSFRETNLEDQYKNAKKNRMSINEMGEKLKEVFKYNRRIYNLKHTSLWENNKQDMALFSWLEPWMNDNGYAIYISVMDEAGDGMTSENRNKFIEMGLEKLARIGYRDSYIGIINDGTVYFEQSDHSESPIVTNGFDYQITSGGMDSGNVSSIIINGKEYSLSMRGINLVAYDKALQEVVSVASFDTHANPIHMENDTGDGLL